VTKIWGKWLLISIDVEGFGKSDDIGSFLIWELMVQHFLNTKFE
jgi:hypothetical protein